MTPAGRSNRLTRGRADPAHRAMLTALLAVLLAACGSQPAVVVTDRATTPTPPPAAVPPASTPAPTAKKPSPWVLKKGGGFYKDDGPGDDAPEDLEAIPDAVPRAEPLHRFANNPYSVLGRDYVPMRSLGPFRQRGIGSWYGRKFHGQKTSSGERYDMYAMTAAHPTLPIPSYVRVTNPANGKSVVLRVNDRGPFHADRIIDLSWTAAAKLGYIGNGSTLVEVETVMPGEAPPALAAAPRNDAIDRLIASNETRPLPQSRDARGHYLQVGAFGNRDNAEAMLAHLARELPDGLGDKLGVFSSGPLHKVQLGPFADAGEARRIADQLREAFGMTPVTVTR